MSLWSQGKGGEEQVLKEERRDSLVRLLENGRQAAETNSLYVSPG